MSKKIENQHMDEAVDLDSQGSEEIQSQEESEQAEEDEDLSPQRPTANEGNKKPPGGKQAALNRDEDDDSEKGDADSQIPGGYHPGDYAHLKVTNEIKDLFKYIARYQPESKELEAKLKPFVPDFYPAVGEVDAYIKMPRPDNKEESLGLNILDEPCLNQSNRAVLGLVYADLIKKPKGEKGQQQVHSIPNAEKNPKEIQNWINSVAQNRKTKQPHSVAYSKPMPDIDDLMQVWPPEIEDALSRLQIPSEELDLSIEDYSKMACALLDIPVHAQQTGNSNIIESLHVLFTLYSEFKANQHFQQNKNDTQQYDQMQLQIN